MISNSLKYESTPKSPKSPLEVIPAKAGIQSKHTLLDTGFRRGDDFWTFQSGLKYAFPKDRTGEIIVNLKKQDKELELTVMDNGTGIPDGLDWKNSSTLRLKLVRTLVENQLDGSIDLDNTNGTKFTIKFNIET